MRSILVDRHPRPVDALATATARVVPVAACACERFHLRSLPSAGIARLPRYLGARGETPRCTESGEAPA